MIRNESKIYGIFLASLGFSVFILNIVSFYLKTGKIHYIDLLNILTLLISLSIFITSFFKLGKLFQIFGLMITGFLTLFENPTDGICILQFIIVFMLSKKYGFLKTYLNTKLVIFLILFIYIMQLSIINKTENAINLTSTILFYSFFIVSVFIIQREELLKKTDIEKKNKEEINNLKSDINNYKTRLNQEKFVDPIKSGLTNKELEVLKTLCYYKEKNIDLAIRLEKSESTIKAQISKIMLKIGADNRYQLIEKCKNYFIQNEIKQ